MKWIPLLSRHSELGAQAWDAIVNIAHAVAEKDDVAASQLRAPYRGHEQALLYAYLAVAFDDLGWANRATECLNGAIDDAGRSYGYFGLFGGVAGLGWTVEHVAHLLKSVSEPQEEDEGESPSCQNVDDETDEDLNAEIDSAVLSRVLGGTASSPYDLVSGLVGFGTYFLERLPRKSAIQGIQAVFDRLESLADGAGGKTRWHSGPELLPDWQRKECPNGYYNLGVAHGIPGIIHFLSEIAGTNIVEQARSQSLRDGAISWLLAQRRPEGSLSRFSAWLAPDTDGADSRLAWCYGDLGIMSVLRQVARRTGRHDWQGFADELLNHCLAWPLDRTGIGDAPLCHGAAGVAHIFNRIYQTEGDPRCLDAALRWYQRTMSFRKNGTGVGGFSSLTRPDPLGPHVWEASSAFLDGAAGVGLALLAAVTPIEPEWDRMLLLSGKDRLSELSGAR